jgi:cytochrome c556
MQKLTKVVAVAALALTSAAALAQQPKPEDVIKYRRSVMNVIGWNFGPMAAMVQDKIPFNKEVFARNAGRVAAMSKMPLEGFIPGTEKGETKAKPELWQNFDDFKSKLEKMQGEADKLAEVAKGGDEAAMRAQFGATGKACKACHDEYRAK